MADFSNIIQEINTNLPDNNAQSITAAKLRTTLIDLTNQIDTVQDDFETNIQNEFDTLSENLNFESGQNIGNVDIVDNLATKSSDDVLSANQGNVLGLRTKEATITETQITEYTINNGHIVSNGNINVQSTPTDTKYAEIQIPEGENRHLRFRGLTYSSSIQIGYCFYKIVDGVEKIIKGNRFTVTGTNSNQEYNIAVPVEATIFRTTVKRLTNNIENSFYCYLQTGKTLGDTPTFQELGSAFDTSEAKTLSLIFGYLQTSGITVSDYLPFTSENAYWNCTTHQQVSNTVATSLCLSTTDVSEYDYIMFVGQTIISSSTIYGYAFFKDNNTLIYDKSFDVDASSTNSKIYFVKVPPEAKWFKTMNNSQYYNIVGLRGKTLKEDVFDWIDGLYLEKDSLDYWSETVVSGKNLINANDLLEGWTISSGQFIEKANSYMSNKLYLQNGQTYTVQNIYLANSTPKSILLGRFDENDNYLGRNLYYVTSESQWSGNVASVISFRYVSLGEAYTRLVLNFVNVPSITSLSTATMLEVGSEASPWEPYETTEVYDIAKESDLEALEERVETIEDILDITGKLMKVTIADTYFDVRSKHSETEDILIHFAQMNNTANKNLQSTTLNTVYIGPKGLPDAQLKTSSYLISTPSDSIGAIGVNSFWYLYAQHGWTIARGSNGGQVDSTDVGSIWKDQSNRQFYLGYVTGSYVYWVPVCTQDEETGVWTASWNGNNTYPSSFTYVSGTATHTASFSMSTSRYDVRVQTQAKEYVADGTIVENGTYYCNDFTFNEYILGHNPATVDPTQLFIDWDNDDKYNGELINWSRCFDFKCGSFKYMCSMNVVNPFEITNFYAVIPQMPLQNGNYHSYSFIPKVKKIYDGNMICKPFNSDTGVYKSGDTALVTASKNTVFDSTDLPDRVVTYLKDNSNKYKCVEAAGFVLNEGIAQKSIRNTNLANMSNTANIMTYGTGDFTKNKLYVWLLDDTTYPNAIVENTVALNYSGFFSFTDQNIQAENVFVNWYKDNDGYVIYVHGQQAYNKVEILLPDFMNGYKLDNIIEKTGNSDVLTDVVVSNRMYVKLPSQTYYDTENFDANYIVFRIK